MEDNPGTSAEPTTHMETPQLPAGTETQKRSKTWIFVLVAVLVVALVIGLIVLLLASAPESVGKIRDIFIIFLALESLITGAVLIILVVQISLLINLLQNEIKPILESTNETVNTLKGTTTFITNNLTEPVIRLNEYLAGLKKLLDLLFPARR
ncbi:MAG TPA: hypothetical protein VMS73_00895 [Anaerolineaceae bacterium]|nr:hypothetical protein [Anaerolineaceae bacterium]